MGLLHLVSLLIAGSLAWEPVPCPTHRLPGPLAREAAASSSWALARSCAAAAYSQAGTPQLQAKALALLQSAQLQLLLQEEGAPADPGFSATFSELLRLMAWKELLTLPELDALRGRWDVYLLHGQLACLEESGGGAGEAVRSFALALAIRESSAVRRLLARVSLGRGHLRSALRSATAARRHREAPADSAAALLLQFQALVLLQAGNGSSSSSSSSSSALALDARGALAGDSALEAEPEDVWEEVRELVQGRFKALGVALPPEDPLRLAEGRLPAFLLPAPAAPASAGTLAVPQAQQELALWRAAATPAAAQEWAAKGYTVLRGLLPPAYHTALLRRHQQLFYPSAANGGSGSGSGSSGGLRIEPDAGQRRRLLWDEELSLYIGTRLLPAVAAIAGLPLSSTYACSIAYSAGGDLKPHVDREQNAISLTYNLGLQPDSAPDWPIWVSPAGRGEEEGVPVHLRPNDGMLYGGVHHKHFRHPLSNATASMQVIFGFRGIHEKHCNSQ